MRLIKTNHQSIKKIYINKTMRMKLLYEKLKTTRSLLSLLLLGIFLLAAAAVQAQNVTVVTDQDDYFPGSWVHITGTGWQAGETVQVVIKHMIFTSHPDETMSLTADGIGNIDNHSNYFVDDDEVGELFKLTAKGLSSGYSAVTFFTDSKISTIIPSSGTEGTSFVINGGGIADPHALFCAKFSNGTELVTTYLTWVSTSELHGTIPALTPGVSYTITVFENNCIDLLPGADPIISGFTYTSPVTFTCGIDVTVPACSSQEEVNTAWTAFLASTTATGGCNGVLSNNGTTPPSSCGGSVDVTWTYTSTCAPLTTTCTKRFTVTAAPAVEFNCGSDVTVAACSTQAQVDAAYASFIASTAASGGCNGSLSNDAPTAAPAICGGYVDVTWTYTSDCAPLTTTCTKRFTVETAPAVDLQVPENYTGTTCMKQSDVVAAFNNWLGSVQSSGGCNAVLKRYPEYPTAPSLCGGVKTVTWTVTSNCEAPVSKTRTFTIPEAPPVVLTVPENYLVDACSAQNNINESFIYWYEDVKVEGGCNSNLQMNPEDPEPPSACGGVVAVTWTVTSSCQAPVSKTRTFTVLEAPVVVFICGSDVTVPACSDQATVNAAYASFIASTTASGGCNGHLTNNAPADAPPICGGFVDVTWTYTSSCDVDHSCTKRFTVAAAPAVTLTVPPDKTSAVYMTQAEVDAVFATWLAQVSYSGGCNSTLIRSPLSPAAPSLCGGFIEVTWTVTSSCEGDKVGKSTFTVPTNVAPVITSVTAPLVPVPINTPVTLTVVYSDQNVNKATINWDDGTTTTINSPLNSFTATHTYIKPEVYSPIVTVYDVCGLSASVPYQYFVVYDPNAGFVTGGGWINSPVGAYSPDLTLTGKANFGFVSKYQKGKTVPDGNTEFQFHAAGMNFKSSVYEWLVVAGMKAQFKGSGTLNGSGNYGFMLSAIDGTPDKFRIKIWNKDAGDAVVYDNQMAAPLDADPTTAISGGSIVVHTSNKSAEVIAPIAGNTNLLVYPNPFSDKLKFEFAAPADMHARINLYDVTGRMVQTVFDNEVKGGIDYHAEFVPSTKVSGMYFYRMTLGEEVINGKVMYKQ
jgi:hypothetical protein